jgi:hypothetical protein
MHRKEAASKCLITSNPMPRLPPVTRANKVCFLLLVVGDGGAMIFSIKGRFLFLVLFCDEVIGGFGFCVAIK